MIVINKDREVMLNGEKFKYENFKDNFYLYAQKKLDTKSAVMISADKRLGYGEVMFILSAVKLAGFSEVSLATNG